MRYFKEWCSAMKATEQKLPFHTISSHSSCFQLLIFWCIEILSSIISPSTSSSGHWCRSRATANFGTRNSRWHRGFYYWRIHNFHEHRHRHWRKRMGSWRGPTKSLSGYFLGCTFHLPLLYCFDPRYHGNGQLGQTRVSIPLDYSQSCSNALYRKPKKQLFCTS